MSKTYQGCRSPQRVGAAGNVRDAEVEGYAGHQLERRQRVAGDVVQLSEQRDGGIDRRHRDERRLAHARLGEQLQNGGGDDAERPFRAEKELLQVVAGVVLAQSAQAVPDPAVRQHYLQPEHKLASIAVP